MSIINEYTFFLDSKYRDSTSTNANPSFTLDDPIVISDTNNYFECQVLSCDIPFSFKNLTTPNNKLYCRLIVVEDSINYYGQITIPEGNYSITNLLSVLGSQLTTFCINAGFGGTKTPHFENFVYSVDTGKCTLDIAPGSGTHTVSLTMYWGGADILAEYFGFSYLNDTVLSFTGAVVNSTNYISPNNVNVSPITSLYIRSASLHQPAKNQERMVENVFSVSDILCKVPVNSYFNTWLLYENSEFTVRLNNKTIDVISFYITAMTYDNIIFNGVHWRVSIRFREIQPDEVKQRKLIEMQQLIHINELNNQKLDLVGELAKIQEDLRKNMEVSNPVPAEVQ